MKKHILLTISLFISILSYAQYDFLKASLRYISSAPTYLVVKVKSPSYEGEAAIFNDRFINYYKTIKYKSLELDKYYPKIWWKKDMKLAYRDIKQGKYFIISDEDLEIKYGQYQSYYFKKIIVNDSVLNIAKKGIDFFIRTYFDGKGIFEPPSSYEPSDFYTIVKVMFDAEIVTGIDCEYEVFQIRDSRFYIRDNEKEKFIIPPEYRDSKE